MRISLPRDAVFALCQRQSSDEIDTEFSNDYTVWFASHSAFLYPSGLPEKDCITQVEATKELALLEAAGIRMLVEECGADNMSLECEPFDKIDAKILINKLKQIGFTHDKAYQKSVDSTFLEG